MKNTFFPLLFLALATPAFAQTTVSLAGNPQTLLCELVDLRAGRTLDQGAVAIQSREPGVLLLGYGVVSGTVRDWPDGEGQRLLDMELKYDSSMGWGRSEGRATYRVDASATSEPVGSIQIEEPTWRRLIQLRCFALDEPPGSHALDPVELSRDRDLSSSPSPMEIWYETGRGRADGYCGGSSGYFCMDQVKSRAREDAIRDGRWACEFRGGRADPFTPSCFESCIPASLPLGSPNQWVNCTSQCSIRCEKR